MSKGPIGGIPSGAGQGGVKKSDSINPSSSKDIDSIIISASKTCRWLLEVRDNVAGKISSEEIIAQEKSSAVKFTEYGIVGDFINYVVNVTSDGTNIKLNVTNNEGNQILTKILRMTI